jgi:hypothetical protein
MPPGSAPVNTLRRTRRRMIAGSLVRPDYVGDEREQERRNLAGPSRRNTVRPRTSARARGPTGSEQRIAAATGNPNDAADDRFAGSVGGSAADLGFLRKPIDVMATGY